MDKILIVDFDDSFTFNIAEICKSMSLSFDVLGFESISLEEVKLKNYRSIIWGPGPGHPEQYVETLKIISSLLEEDIFHLGICLGHQLIFKALGYGIIDAPEKKHGRSLKIKIPSWEVFEKSDWGKLVDVQFYSSLAVESSKENKRINTLTEDGVILSGNAENFLSYQFHPESVGTSCPETFFRVLKEKLIQ